MANALSNLDYPVLPGRCHRSKLGMVKSTGVIALIGILILSSLLASAFLNHFVSQFGSSGISNELACMTLKTLL